MIINRNIQLELQRIDVVENPINERGKFVAYSFRLHWPLDSAFLNDEWPKHNEESLTVHWGSSPNMTYYSKENRLVFEKLVKEKIQDNITDKFSISDVTKYQICISDYSTKINDRSWCIMYDARQCDRRNRNLTHHISGERIFIDKEFMDKIIDLMPSKIINKLEMK